MNKKFPKWILFLAIPCVLLAAGYLALMQYYKINIPYGTWINDIYCTGLSYDEAAELLLKGCEYELAIDVVDDEGVVHHLAPDASLYTLSFRENLDSIVAEYGLRGLFTEKKIYLEPNIFFKEEVWAGYLAEQFLFQDKLPETSAERVYIVETESGFELVDLCKSVLDVTKASDEILKAVRDHKKQISLVDAGCYYEVEHGEEEKITIASYEALQSFCHRMTLELTIQGEPAYTVDASVLKNWILTDKDGQYISGKGGIYLLDEQKVKAYAKSISEDVTTYFGKNWEFVNHNGDTIEVPAGNYGRSLKTSALAAKLMEAFQTAASGTYELEFDFYPASAADVEYGAGYGDSYAEVDIESQHIYLYIDGELVLDSPCVTGDVRRKRETPKGVFYIEYKQRNRTLRGEDYATPVSYWMHFYNHCGFHDANWRRKFGEDIYLNDGSHGCVNMPPAKAKELYDLVYKGMPVLVY